MVRSAPPLLLLSLAWLASCGEDPVIADWRDCTYASPDDPPEAAAAWYACVDERVQDGEGCGPDGYLLGFGGKYAERYMVEVRPGLSEAGQAFLDGVLVCLQEGLAAGMSDDPTCDAIETAGFGAHAPCYEANGFCDLPIEDVARIAAAIDAEDQGIPAEQEAIEAIQAKCTEG